MEAFIASVELGDWRGKTSIDVLLAGYNFNYQGFEHPSLKYFKEEYRQDLKQVIAKIKELSPLTEFLMLRGGEPCLQRPAVEVIAKKAVQMQLSNVLFTNASKPLDLKKLLDQGLFSTVVVDFIAPLNEKFETIAKAGTFLKPGIEVALDVKKSFEILKRHANNSSIGLVFETKIIPGLLFRKQDLLQMASELQGIYCEWRLKPGMLPSRQGLEKPSTKFLNQLKKEIKKEYPELMIIVED